MDDAENKQQEVQAETVRHENLAVCQPRPETGETNGNAQSETCRTLQILWWTR